MELETWLTTATCNICDRSDSYYATEISGTVWVIENCNYCKAEGQTALKIDDTCQDCDSVATHKVSIVMARGNEPEIIHACDFHKSNY